MKRLACVLAIITLILMCANDVSKHGNGAIFTGCVFLGMAFVALGCMALNKGKIIKDGNRDKQNAHISGN